MASLHRTTLLALTFLGALSVPGCFGKDPYNPGESLGTFNVTGALVSTTCGTTPNPWQFDVKLRHENNILYWVQGAGPISGQVDPTARAVMKATTSQTMREANERTRVPACVLTREDNLDVTLSPVTTPVSDMTTATAFSGTLTYRFAPTEGSQCDDQLLDTGGDYAALPCEVKYTLSAQKSATGSSTK